MDDAGWPAACVLKMHTVAGAILENAQIRSGVRTEDAPLSVVLHIAANANRDAE